MAYASQTGRNALTVRAHNRRLLLLRLLRRQPISRVRLSREVGLSTTTVTNLVSELMVNYYDPLYRHTLPERRIEVDSEPEETVLERIQAAVAEVLNESTNVQ